MADKKINEYTQIGALSGDELFVISKDGQTYNCDADQVNDFVQATVDTKISEVRNGRTDNLVGGGVPSLDIDQYDCFNITGIDAPITDVQISGLAVDFRRIKIRLKDNGTSRLITWGSAFVSIGISLPTSTTTRKWHTLEFEYNDTLNAWGCVLSLVQP